jgi:hypothetical protein
LGERALITVHSESGRAFAFPVRTQWVSRRAGGSAMGARFVEEGDAEGDARMRMNTAG